MPISEPRTTLIRLRELAGWDRAQLAKKIGITEVHVWRIETGERNPPIKLMRKWIAALDGAEPYMFFTKEAA